jgi:aspartate aminotransferase-like enzyme
MAMSIGAEAEICAFPYDSIPTPQKVCDQIKKCKPKVVTAVHCETPSGTLTNCLAEIGNAAREIGALFVVDFVSSAGGAPLDVDACKIDIGLWGSQKVLSITPEFAISSISPRAWEVIEKVNYSGYDAYKAWHRVPEKKMLPYTHDWHGMKALNLSLEALTREGLEASCKRHEEAAKLCRDMGREMGLKLFPKSENFCSPTVTTFYVPEKYNWREFDAKLREHGLVVGDNYGKLADHTFRIGHMGSQADINLVREGMNIIREVL